MNICTPKSSMENPSPRVSGHVSRMKRTFVVEEYDEDDFGQRANDEVPGEQSYVDDERSCLPQLLQGFWYKLKKKNAKIVVMSPTVAMKSYKQQEVISQQYHLRLAVAEHQILGGQHFLFVGQKQEEFGG